MANRNKLQIVCILKFYHFDKNANLSKAILDEFYKQIKTFEYFKFIACKVSL